MSAIGGKADIGGCLNPTAPGPRWSAVHSIVALIYMCLRPLLACNCQVRGPSRTSGGNGSPLNENFNETAEPAVAAVSRKPRSRAVTPMA